MGPSGFSEACSVWELIHYQEGQELMVVRGPLWVGWGPQGQEKGDAGWVWGEMVVDLCLVC